MLRCRIVARSGIVTRSRVIAALAAFAGIETDIVQNDIIVGTNHHCNLSGVAGLETTRGASLLQLAVGGEICSSAAIYGVLQDGRRIFTEIRIYRFYFRAVCYFKRQCAAAAQFPVRLSYATAVTGTGAVITNPIQVLDAGQGVKRVIRI